MPNQLIELKQNPRASDHRVRATLKTFKKNYHDEAMAACCRDIHGNIIGRGFGMNLNDRIKILVDENVKQRSLLKEKTYELEALTSKYRKIQSMVQSGQFLQAVNTSVTGTTSATGSVAGVGSSALAGKQQPTPRGEPLGASGSMVFSSAAGTTLVNSPSGTMNKSTNQLGATTAILMTSRSPTRERVSFSSALNAHDHEQPSSSDQRQRQQKSALANNQERQTLELDTMGLRRSPMMSSTTQITQTTTTTSSTNNATDLTADFSSSRMLMSGAPTSSSSSATWAAAGRQQHHHQLMQRFDAVGGGRGAKEVELEDGTDLGERVQAISRQVAASRQLQHQRRDQAGENAAQTKQRLAFRSQEDLNLFTILSYADNSRRAARVHDEEATNNQNLANNKLGQWLEGPFCTVLLRQTSLDRNRQRVGATTNSTNPALKRHNNLSRSARFRKQCSQQADHSRDRVGLVPTKTMLMSNVRERLPRTLSMIEYLSLNDFELIARRHDKILRYKRNMNKQTNSRLLSCCASCSCFLSQHQLQLQTGQQQPAHYYHHSSSQTLGRHNFRHRPVQQLSDGNLVTVLSSSCDGAGVGGPLNYSVEDFLQTSNSLVSCSTCCSLASQTYGSHSELYHHVGAVSGHHYHRGNNHELTLSGSSTSGESSRTISSSMSESSSIVIGGGGNRHLAGALLRDPSDSQSGGGSATSPSTSSHSSSIMVLNQAATCPIHHHHDHYRYHYHHHLRESTNQQQRVTATTTTQHLSSEATSTRSEASSNTTQVTTATQRPQNQPLQKSLCTSGVLYGAPAAKEDANDAAHLGSCGSSGGPVMSTRSDPATSTTLSPISHTPTNDINKGEPPSQPSEQSNAIISIKCDILEDL